MTEPPVDPETGHAVVTPTMPGVVLVNVTHPDDPPATCTVEEAKRAPRTYRWSCELCPAKGKAKGLWAATAATVAHDGTCPGNPRVKAAREAARSGRRNA